MPGRWADRAGHVPNNDPLTQRKRKKKEGRKQKKEKDGRKKEGERGRKTTKGRREKGEERRGDERRNATKGAKGGAIFFSEIPKILMPVCVQIFRIMENTGKLTKKRNTLTGGSARFAPTLFFETTSPDWRSKLAYKMESASLK